MTSDRQSCARPSSCVLLKQHTFAKVMSSSPSDETQAQSCGIQPYQFKPRIAANVSQSSSGEEDSDRDDDRSLRLKNSEDWWVNEVLYDFYWRKIFRWPVDYPSLDK